ncbi:MAG: hypothetical protein ACK55I_03990, partial [bacterium]
MRAFEPGLLADPRPRQAGRNGFRPISAGKLPGFHEKAARARRGLRHGLRQGQGGAAPLGGRFGDRCGARSGLDLPLRRVTRAGQGGQFFPQHSSTRGGG